jgi:hypothetical protein
MSTAGFYRIDVNGQLLHAPNRLATPTGMYEASAQKSYKYPIDGAWHYFDSEEAAMVGLVTTQSSGVPPVVSMAQAKRQLVRANLIDHIDAAVAQADKETQVVWQTATEIRRDSEFIENMKAAVNLNDEQIDQLFIAASQIV